MIILAEAASKTMTKTQQIDRLYDEISRQDTWFATVFTIIIAIIGIIVTLFTIMQWHLSKDQLAKLQTNILNKVDNRYKTRVETLEDALKKHKEYQINRAILASNSLNDKFGSLQQCTDFIQIGSCTNDITNTIENILNNDMVDDAYKFSAMAIVANNIQTAKRIGQEAKIKPIYDFITTNKQCKKYYQASRELFEELQKNNSSDDKHNE